MALMYKPTTWKITKCSSIYKSLLKELTSVELKAVWKIKKSKNKKCPVIYKSFLKELSLAELKAV